MFVWGWQSYVDLDANYLTPKKNSFCEANDLTTSPHQINCTPEICTCVTSDEVQT